MIGGPVAGGRVVGRREGYSWTLQKEPVTVEGAPLAGLELRLDGAAVICGRILGLEPGERAKAVWASTGSGNGGRREGQLDQEGGFVITDVPPGDWTVTVVHGGRKASAPVHLESGREDAWVEVEIGELPAEGANRFAEPLKVPRHGTEGTARKVPHGRCQPIRRLGTRQPYAKTASFAKSAESRKIGDRFSVLYRIWDADFATCRRVVPSSR